MILNKGWWKQSNGTGYLGECKKDIPKSLGKISGIRKLRAKTLVINAQC